MDQQYGTRIKSEDVELGIRAPVKQEREEAESVPAVVPKLEPTDKEMLASLRKQRKKARKEQKRLIASMSEGERREHKQGDLMKQNTLLRKQLAEMRPKRSHSAESRHRRALEKDFVRVCQERDKAIAERNEEFSRKAQTYLVPKNRYAEIQNSRLRQELADARKTITDTRATLRASDQRDQALPLRHEPEPTVMTNGASTITALRAEISDLERQLREACRQGENAIRDARAADNNDSDVDALEEELAREQGKDRAMASKLQKALKKEQDKSEGVHSGSHQVNEQEAAMTGWPGSRGPSIRQRVKVEDEDMKLEDGE
ncbi:uncharacterized protein J4E88_008009 [Alternaria novae-zelandiae]|uniref:uncharacterized protein n=1 Tax=Alternaria novae-zelandiae TaxID=430562 RepID=UPI0020C366C0|nr:uncharacterized protein J4E88_008009 [Alternaria novae-zelandiae]KAI4675105.1 hypothetical protein J4E88_008009 [Alternaria novae-zelandiae]